MKNLNHGDADSVGFFQMRVGIWNQGAYAGYPEKPELQVKWFLDQAEAVKKQRLVAGKPIDDPNHFGEWIADVERPAEQYRGRYQTKLAEANQLLASSPQQPVAAAPVRRPRRGGGERRRGRQREAPGGDPRPGSGRDRGRQRARPEGAGRDRGGLQVPRHGLQVGRLDAADRLRLLRADAVVLRAVGRPDPARDVHADRGAERHRGRGPRRASSPATSCSSPTRGDVHHVGMYLGDQKFLHAPSTGDVVKVSSLDEPYYAGQFAGGRRFDDGAAGRRRAGGAPPPRSAPAVDPTAVAKAQAAVARDAAEVRRQDSALFLAVKAEEATKETREAPVGAVPEGDRPVTGQAPRGSRAAAAARRAPVAPPPPGGRSGGARPRRSRPSLPRRSTSRTPPPTTPATTRRRLSSRSGSPSRPRRPACRPSCR